MQTTADLETQSAPGPMLVRELVEAALAPFRASEAEAERFELDGPAMRLSGRTAPPFAAALAELAANAARHGALSTVGGQIRVTWWLQRRDGAARLKLQWRESGGPLGPPTEARALGPRLIERGLAAELDGAVTLDFRREGLICSIDAPAPYPARPLP